MSFTMRPFSMWVLLLAGFALGACGTGGPRVLVKDAQGDELRKKETTLQCTDRDGQTLYTGPYNEESWNGYLVQLDDTTRAFYPKGVCRKMPA